MQADLSQMPPASRRSLAVIFFIMLMDIMGLTILAPVAPFIVARYNSAALDVTLITVIYAAAQFFAAPAMGKLGDRYGRRPILLFSIAGSVIGYLIFGIGGALWILFLSRLIDGITGGNLSTASAYIADISRPEELAKNFTVIGMAWGAGLIFGPVVGTLFSTISLDAPAFAAAGLAMIGVLLVYFFLPESLPKERRQTTPMRARDFNPFISIAEMGLKPGLPPLLIVLCLFNLAFSGINTTQNVFIRDKFEALPWQLGLLLVLIGIAVAIVQGIFVPRWIPRYGEKAVGAACLILFGIGSLVAFFVPFFWLIFAVLIFNAAVAGFVFPTMTTLTVTAVSRSEQGLLMGVTTALQSLMNIFGPLAAGAVYDHVMRGSPFWIGGLILIAAGFLLSQTKKRAINASESLVPTD